MEMRKYLFFYLFVAVCIASLFTSCDEDDVIRSSEANITSFTFDTTVAANAAVLSQPVIDEANATITFKAEEDGDVSALVPTIELRQAVRL